MMVYFILLIVRTLVGLEIIRFLSADVPTYIYLLHS